MKLKRGLLKPSLLVAAPFAADLPLNFSTVLLLEKICFFAGLEISWGVSGMDNSVFHNFLFPFLFCILIITHDFGFVKRFFETFFGSLLRTL